MTNIKVANEIPFEQSIYEIIDCILSIVDYQDDIGNPVDFEEISDKFTEELFILNKDKDWVEQIHSIYNEKRSSMVIAASERYGYPIYKERAEELTRKDQDRSYKLTKKILTVIDNNSSTEDIIRELNKLK